MDLAFHAHPEVTIATNTFINVPTILQFEDTPLIEIVKELDTTFLPKFTIYDSDGNDIAVVKGTRIFPTEKGKLANVSIRDEPDILVCELEDKPIFELRRTAAHAFKGWAELYAPEGVFIKMRELMPIEVKVDGDILKIGGMSLSGNYVDVAKIGIHVTKTSISIPGG
jgi:hypothetical protein